MITLTTRRHFLATTIGLLAGGTALAARPDATLQQAITKGRQFLVDLFDPTLDLLPEYRGFKTYWLFHDNYLAAQVLYKSHPEIANKIDAALQREKVTSSGKIEILFGGKEASPCYHYELLEVRRAGEKIIKTEKKTDKINKNWDEYADLLFLKSICERDCGVFARGCAQAGAALWDGNGFCDPATKKHNQYATYKLALARLASSHSNKLIELSDSYLPKLLNLQEKSGGWITDYDANGKPLGLANVETTCLVLLAFETYRA